MSKDSFPVIEVFGPTIQGEGALCGQRTHFVRFGGCGYRCSWCDSMHAVDPELIKANATYCSAASIVHKVNILSEAPWVTLSGGDPVMHNLGMVVADLHVPDYESGHRKFKVAVETQGQLWKPWLTHCDLVTVSPKPPSSGMSDKTNMATLWRYRAELGNRLVFKVVVFNAFDLYWAEDLHKTFGVAPFYLSSGTSPEPIDDPMTLRNDILNTYTWLVEEALKRPALSDVTILPQMHALCWGHEKGR